MLAQHQRGDDKPEERLQQLQLPDRGNAAERQPAIPEHETDPHAEQRDIGQPPPSRRIERRPIRWAKHKRERDAERKR